MRAPAHALPLCAVLTLHTLACWLLKCESRGTASAQDRRASGLGRLHRSLVFSTRAPRGLGKDWAASPVPDCSVKGGKRMGPHLGPSLTHHVTLGLGFPIWTPGFLHMAVVRLH